MTGKMCGKFFKKKIKSQNTFKNSMTIFWFPGKDIQLSEIFKKKSNKVDVIGSFPSSPIYSVKNLRSKTFL